MFQKQVYKHPLVLDTYPYELDARPSASGGFNAYVDGSEDVGLNSQARTFEFNASTNDIDLGRLQMVKTDIFPGSQKVLVSVRAAISGQFTGYTSLGMFAFINDTDTDFETVDGTFVLRNTTHFTPLSLVGNQSHQDDHYPCAVAEATFIANAAAPSNDNRYFGVGMFTDTIPTPTTIGFLSLGVRVYKNEEVFHQPSK